MDKRNTGIVGITRVSLFLLAALGTTGAWAGGVEGYTGRMPWAETAADFNGDGMADIAVVNYFDNNVAVLFNTTASGSASLSLADEQSFDAGPGPEGVAAADLNGDGKPDLIVADFNDYIVSVLINTTVPGSLTASFAPAQTFTVGDGPFAVIVADVNGDGKPDVLTATMHDCVVSVLLNTTTSGSSTASFADVQTFAVGSSPWALAAVDLNGDGKPDVAVVNIDDNTASVLINTTTTGSNTAGFVDQQVIAVGNVPQSIAAGDLNGDGKPDLVVVGQADETVSVMINATVASSTTADFATTQIFSAATGSHSVAIADVNGDGAPDIVVADTGSASAAVLVNTTAAGSATASFDIEQDFSADAGWAIAVLTADMNGDGMPEIVLANAGDNSAAVFLNATAPGDSSLDFVAP